MLLEGLKGEGLKGVRLHYLSVWGGRGGGACWPSRALSRCGTASGRRRTGSPLTKRHELHFGLRLGDVLQPIPLKGNGARASAGGRAAMLRQGERRPGPVVHTIHEPGAQWLPARIRRKRSSSPEMEILARQEDST